MFQENKKTESKVKNGSKSEITLDKSKKSEKGSAQEKYPLNPDYLNQIVVLGKILIFYYFQIIVRKGFIVSVALTTIKISYKLELES